jgi:hypothetical protein
MTESIRERMRGLDWEAARGSLDEWGYAHLPRLLPAVECAGLRRLYGEDRRFRSTIAMARHRFGVGEYRYFANPLPRIVQELRTHAYPFLAPVANEWAQRLGESRPFPPTLAKFLDLCHR